MLPQGGGIAHIGRDETGVHAQHRRTLLIQQVTQGLSNRVTRGLGGGVRRKTGRAFQRCNRVHLDECPSPIFPENGRKGLRHTHETEHVDLHAKLKRI